MPGFDTIIMVDWSGGNDRGPAPIKDAVWSCAAGEAPIYHRNRRLAEDWLAARIEAEIAAGRRVLAGFDFPFGYPAGFARALLGHDDPLALWEWFADRIEDQPRANNRFDLAGRINRMFPGVGPFWFNGLRREIADLPRNDSRAGHGLAERRRAEQIARGAFSCWQMGGAGAVGGQVMTGLPVLARLRRRFGAAAWPFEPLERAPLALVEVWPSLIDGAVRTGQTPGEIRDAAQVRVLAEAVAALAPGELARMLVVTEPFAAREGWILGLGHEAALERAAGSGRELLQPPPLRDDCFALPAGVDWTPVEEAHALLRARLSPVTAVETLPLAQALGRVLAAPVVAQRSNPPLPNTAVDGYGFAFASLGAGDQVLPLVEGRVAAGIRFSGVVPEGFAIRVLTGAALPDGVDTVILQEDVTLGAGEIAFRGGLKPGANTRRAGEDVAKGATVLPEGRIVTPADLAVCAAVGLSALAVRARLRVAVISTGDELVEAGQPAGPGQIYDANRPMLLGLLQRAGHVPVDLGRVADDRGALRKALDAAAGQADVIVTSGGASAGDEDHVSALLADAGTMALWRIAIKPGRPLALGLWRGAPVFGLPGNPVAAMVCTLVFGLPAMALLSGAGWRAPVAFDVPAAFSKRKKPGRREYLRARIRDGRAEVFKSEGSGRVSGLSWAEGLVELPDGAAEISPGDPVRFLPWGSYGL